MLLVLANVLTHSPFRKLGVIPEVFESSNTESLAPCFSVFVVIPYRHKALLLLRLYWNCVNDNLFDFPPSFTSFHIY